MHISKFIAYIPAFHGLGAITGEIGLKNRKHRYVQNDSLGVGPMNREIPFGSGSH